MLGAMDLDETPVALRFECSAAGAHWEVTGMQLTERLNTPYEMRLELRSDDPAADPLRMLGAAITIGVERAALRRQVHGIVERVEDGITDRDHVRTALTVVPALMALGQRRNSRIFQDKTIPEILQEVLDAGLGAYERSLDLMLVADYPQQEYTVQYRETDLDFVHRLMEENGIGYSFDHEGSSETLVLFDGDGAYVDVVSHGSEPGVLAMVQAGDSPGMREDVRDFQREAQLRPTVARTTVFDWLAPAETQDAENSEVADLGVANGAETPPEREDYEHDEPATLYGYRTDGLDFAAVERQAELRRKLHQRDALRFVGTSTVTGLAPGCKFELLDHPQLGFDRQYLVTSVDHAAGDFANPEVPNEAYTNRFECIPIEVEWRPERRTRRPRIPSVQTATVVGPSGEEIYTDEHGRIKVQFHWDRAKTYDEQSSCFIRVVQPWAGNGWGFVFLPRINMEVTVTFVDGDPDRPIVTGCLYNGRNPPPYPLPDDKTKSTIKSESSPGGGGFNELRFEDAAGSEEIFLHAQKDFNEVVLNDHNTSVDANQSNSVGGNQTNSVTGDQSESIQGQQTMTVDKNRSVTIKGSQSVTIQGSAPEGGVSGSKLGITGDYKVDASNTIEIQAPTHIKLTCGGSSITMVPGKITLTAGGAASLVLDGNACMTSAAGTKILLDGNALTQSSGGSKVLLDGNALAQSSGGAKLLLDANALTQSSGGSKVLLDGNALMSSPGTGTVQAPTATLAGGGGSVEAGGAGVTCAGGQVNVSGGMVNVSGGMVKIN
jgi:type VI secretion system secreted protein VgrG